MYIQSFSMSHGSAFNMTDDSLLTTNSCNTSLHEYPSRTNFENPFNHPVIKCMFICLYTIVFLVCCVGNSLVLYTISRTKRMRTRTNFFLANLAVADLSVGVVCVLPKLSTFLSPTWILGVAMCKIYYFAQSMTYTASILLLTAIAIERYIAITYPLRSKCLVTQNRLIFAQIFIWALSAAYNAPELSMFNLIHVPHRNMTMTYCYLTNPYLNMRGYYTANLVLWYMLPLSIMLFMYISVACTLWKSSKLNESTSCDAVGLRNPSTVSRIKTEIRQETELCYDPSVSSFQTRKLSRQHNGHCTSLNDSTRQIKATDNNNSTLVNLLCGGSESRGKTNEAIAMQKLQNSEILDSNTRDTVLYVRGRQLSHHHDNSEYHHSYACQSPPQHRPRRHLYCDFTSEGNSTSSDKYDMVANNSTANRRARCQYKLNSQRVLSSRRRVIKLLVVILLTFAVCVLTNHLKNVLLFWHIYPTHDTQYDILSPVAYVMLYTNSALNPILYWVFSDTFRRSFKDNCRRSCMAQSRLHSR